MREKPDSKRESRLREAGSSAAYGVVIAAAGLGSAYAAKTLMGPEWLATLCVIVGIGGTLLFTKGLLLAVSAVLRGLMRKKGVLALAAALAVVGAVGVYYYVEPREHQPPSNTPDPRAMAAYAEGNRLFAVNSFGLAEQAYDTAIATEPSAAYYLARGNARLAQQRYDGAMDDYNQAIKREPAHAPAYLARGTLNWLQGRIDAAEDDYRTAIRLKPGDHFYYGRLAVVLYERGRVADVADAYRQAFEQDRSRDWAINGWLGALAEQKNYDEILDQTSRLRAEGVVAAWSEYYEGVVEEERGNDLPALDAYLRAVALDAYGVDTDVYAKIATLYRKFGAIEDCANYQRTYFSLLGRPNGYDTAWCQSS